MDFCVRKQHQTLDRRPPSICSDLSPKVLLVVLSAGLLRGTQGTFPGAGLMAAVLWGRPSCDMMQRIRTEGSRESRGSDASAVSLDSSFISDSRKLELWGL